MTEAQIPQPHVEDLAPVDTSHMKVSDEVAITGLAKGRLKGVGDTARRTSERLFTVDLTDPIPLADGAPETLLVARMRDEAHRFAITYHRNVRGKLSSALDEIDGVGPERRRLLLRHFGSLTAIRQASRDELRAVPGLPAAVAERVFDSLAEPPAAD